MKSKTQLKKTNDEVRFIRESVLTEGTSIYNFKVNKIPIDNYLTPIIDAFFESENRNAIENLLFRNLKATDSEISEFDLSKYHNTHWVNIDFVNNVRTQLDKVKYGDLFHDIVLLLLIYKCLRDFNNNEIARYEPMGAYLMLKHLENRIMTYPEFKDINSPFIKMTIQTPKQLSKIETKTTVGLIEYALRNLFNSNEGKRFINKYYLVEEKRKKIIDGKKLLQGEDRKQTSDRNKINVIRILFVCFRPFCSHRRRRMEAIHNLLCLIGGNDIKVDDRTGKANKSQTENRLTIIENRYRRHVNDLL